MTTVIGLVLFTLDQKVPNKLAEFFLLDAVPDDTAEDYKQLHSQSSILAGTPPTPMSMVSYESDNSRMRLTFSSIREKKQRYVD